MWSVGLVPSLLLEVQEGDWVSPFPQRQVVREAELPRSPCAGDKEAKGLTHHVAHEVGCVA